MFIAVLVAAVLPIEGTSLAALPASRCNQTDDELADEHFEVFLSYRRLSRTCIKAAQFEFGALQGLI